MSWCPRSGFSLTGDLLGVGRQFVVADSYKAVQSFFFFSFLSSLSQIRFFLLHMLWLRSFHFDTILVSFQFLQSIY